jgi:hypothetical protein
MATWSLTYRYLTGLPVDIKADTMDEACAELQRLAGERALEFEGYTDEVHAFFRRGRRRVRFANAQFGG